ncbi:opsin Rh3-like [Ostrea edulis]|uniref:opsin Rh3-like n=1 Tax=Ostrea edulis TaxID=37623 RepID=UPI0024AF50AB|nr:opsin Rh3-like [Ostrea edulis]
MNTSRDTTDPGFLDLTYSERLARLPYSVLVLVLYFIGILGNSLVIHFFRRIQRKKTPSEAIILILAVCDLMTMLLFVSKEYERLRYVMDVKSEIACKITHYFGFSAGLASSFFVSVLAIYRHQRLYKSNTSQTTITRIFIYLFLCSLLSVVLCLPVPFIVGLQQFQVEGFQIRRCWFAEKQVVEFLPNVYIGCLLVWTFASCFIIGFCNFKIIRVLYQSNLTLPNTADRTEITTCNVDQTDMSMVTIEKETDDVKSRKCQQEMNDESKRTTQNTEHKTRIVVSQPSIEDPNVIQDRDEASVIDKTPENETLKLPTSGGNGKIHVSSDTKDAKDDEGEKVALSRSITYTITILIVTVTIMVCYFLFLTLYMFMAFKRTDPSFRRMSIREDAFYTYATDIVAMNAVINPFVYFFSDRKYRNMYKSNHKQELRIYDGSFSVGQF